jgi:hypothetical protein
LAMITNTPRARQVAIAIGTHSGLAACFFGGGGV